MTTNYMEKESSKKKYLAPLVVIMLCLVAITGAAYAYSTTVTGNGDIAGKYTVIDLYKSADAAAADATADFQITDKSFQVRTETDKTAGATKPYVAYVESKDLVFTGYIKIHTTDGTNTEKFTLSGALKYTAPTITGDDPETGAIKVDGKEASEEFADLSDGSLLVYAKGGTGDPLTSLDANTVYYVKITLKITGADADDTFGSFSSLENVNKAVAAFNSANSPELAIKLTATSSA